MSQLGVAKFIAAVALHFPRPKFNDDEGMEAAWMASMNRVLSHYSDDILADAAVRILSKRNPKKDGRFFPSPSECTEVCDEAAEVKRLRETPLISTAQRDPSPWAGWRITLADDLMKSAPGLQASCEGWGLAFHTFCRENGRAPELHEFGQCRQARRNLDVGMQILHADEDAFARGPLMQLGQKMLKRNEEFKAQANGEKAA